MDAVLVAPNPDPRWQLLLEPSKPLFWVVVPSRSHGLGPQDSLPISDALGLVWSVNHFASRALCCDSPLIDFCLFGYHASFFCGVAGFRLSTHPHGPLGDVLFCVQGAPQLATLAIQIAPHSIAIHLCRYVAGGDGTHSACGHGHTSDHMTGFPFRVAWLVVPLACESSVGVARPAQWCVDPTSSPWGSLSPSVFFGTDSFPVYLQQSPQLLGYSAVVELHADHRPCVPP